MGKGPPPSLPWPWKNLNFKFAAAAGRGNFPPPGEENLVGARRQCAYFWGFCVPS